MVAEQGSGDTEVAAAATAVDMEMTATMQNIEDLRMETHDSMESFKTDLVQIGPTP